VVITDGRQPIGRGIGPVLEARDVMQVLAQRPARPQDLRQKSLRLAGRMIEFDPDVRGGDGWRIARDILESGRALAQMNALIDAQGRRSEPSPAGQLTHEVPAPAQWQVIGIDNLQLARMARLAGAPQVPARGWTCWPSWATPSRKASRCTASTPPTRPTSNLPARPASATPATTWARPVPKPASSWSSDVCLAAVF
jgi:hypothetical protein